MCLKSVDRPEWQETKFEHITYFNYKGWGVRVSYGAKNRKVAGLTLYHHACDGVTGADFNCIKCHETIDKETLNTLSKLYRMGGIGQGEFNVPEET